MVSRIAIIILFHVFLSLNSHPTKAQAWIKAGYWYYDNDLRVSQINSTLYTHLICAAAVLNSSSYHLSIPSSYDREFSAFTNTVKRKNPSITTLLSIGGWAANSATLSAMAGNPTYRKSFIDDSIKTARNYGFQGLDFSWLSVNTGDMENMGNLFEEWRAAIALEERNSNLSALILTAAVQNSTDQNYGSFPIDSMGSNLDWIHVLTYDYHMPEDDKFTAASAALYAPDDSDVSTDSVIAAWINEGLPASKLVLGLPFFGYAWKLANPNEKSIGAPATGPAVTEAGDMSYKEINNHSKTQGAVGPIYNSTYVVNYVIVGSDWISYDGVDVVRKKVSYAKEKALLGYVVWEIGQDDNWELSQAGVDHKRPKSRILIIILTTTAAVIILLGLAFYFKRIRILKSDSKETKSKANNAAAAGDLNSNNPDMIIYSLAEIGKATDQFIFENKLGEGGFGPVYKGVLPGGQEIAVKKLSKSSTQGFDEFKNEVMLTAKLQHVNLVKVLGFCVDREEKMLIYEYMPNKSLDYYLFDPIRRYLLDWKKREEIIEGITQGLLYLQEYSRLTIIHRDLKASNILLDGDMKAKISDFGMARIFAKDEHEANTDRLVGTYGYVPPEYIRRGQYSVKSDVYSFGIVLLHIISGKKNGSLYGSDESLSLLEHAYELWKDDRGMEIMDPSLDDTFSSCKLIKCLQIALLCVQEHPADRPSMLEVSSMLRNETAIVAIPQRPAFSVKTDEDDKNRRDRLHLEICSVDDATITQTVGR
ncbi:cysteine-rich receptor protein [Salix suchowensis]|nr:cysteine-rich receptor protein [Salix suchowensis]